jgi:Tol biopolymer transport system component
VETEQSELLLTGDYFVQVYSPDTNNLILSTIPMSGDLFILNLETRQLSLLNQVTYLLSLPSVSSDGRYVAYMGAVSEIPQLLITDVSAFSTNSIEIQKPPELPAVITDWHPAANQFLYEDAGTIYVYNVENNAAEDAITAQAGEEFGIPRWACPP